MSSTQTLEIVFQSQIMSAVLNIVDRVSKFNTTVLITGESGTGKELIAKRIHNNSSRKNKPFVAVNCGAIPQDLIESELFGHQKGAFTDAIRDKPGLFKEANGGTLFLDEIAELPLHLQAKLLRVIQEQRIRPVGSEVEEEIDVRILSATLKDLRQEIVEQNFRDDLYYRLSVVTVLIPPLRERKEDIPSLIEFFIKKIKARVKIPDINFTKEAISFLENCYWKGNVRELENTIERILVLAEKNLIDKDDLPKNLVQVISETKDVKSTTLELKTRTKILEKELILEALKITGNNKSKACKLLGISQRALLYKVKEYGV